MSLLRAHVLNKRAPVAQAVEAPADVLYRAERAKMLLEEPVLVEAFAEIEIAHIEDALRAEDDEARRRAADRANAVRDVRIKLAGIVAEAERKARDAVKLP